ncbi:MAG: Thiol-disulfide isomerase [Myxococcales bacterium]|nr:Thiol-disulfide isomerase [Myxococcales bacterium]
MTRVSALVCLMLVVSPAWAQTPAPVDDRAQQAKLHYETGMAHFQLEEWDKAIEEWQAGFLIKPVPQFLYNIAQAYRQSKRPEKALGFYQKYLRMEPKASNRAEVERHIAQLNKLIDQQSKTASQPPVGTIEADPSRARPGDSATPPREPKPAVTTPPAAATPTVATTAPATNPPTATPTAATTPAPSATATATAAGSMRGDLTASAPSRKPITRRGWFWGVIGGVGAVVIAGVVVGVVLATSADSTKTLPMVRF